MTVDGLIRAVFEEYPQVKEDSSAFISLEHTDWFIAEFKGARVDDIDILRDGIHRFLTRACEKPLEVKIVREGWLPRSQSGGIDVSACTEKWKAIVDAEKKDFLVNGTFEQDVLDAEKDCFAHFGSYSRIRTPVDITYPDRIKIGNWVSLGRYGKIVMLPTESFAGTEAHVQQHYPQYINDLKKFPVHVRRDPVLKFGDGTTLGDQYFIICTKSIEFGKHVMASGRLFVTDCQHLFGESEIPSVLLPVTEGRSVKIDDYVWMGINCSILDGVTIGKHSVIAANSVVKDDVPPYSVVAGAPAQIKKRFVPPESGL